MKRLVLVGAGHAHARVLLEFARHPAPDTEVTLVSPEPLAPYSGMVPGWMAGHFTWNACCIDFAHLCRQAGATLRTGMATGIDTAGSTLQLEDGDALAYDVLSIDIGSTAAPPTSIDVLLLPMRPLGQLKERWEALRADVCALPTGARYRVVMIGGGAAGTESMLAARHQLLQWAPDADFDFVLATQGDALLPALASGAATRIATHLAAHGIRVVHGFEADRFEAGGVTSCDGRTLPADVVLWATGAKAHAWPGRSGLAQDAAGFIKVDHTLQSVSHPNIFASGDCASWATPLPKAGVFAVRMGPVLAHNVRALLDGRSLKPFVPQRRYLVLLGTGGEHAVAAWGPFAWQGKWVWRWKRRIDQRFLDQYNDASNII